jgi:hypothetical protein
VDLYIHSPIRLHGVVLKHRNNFNFHLFIRGYFNDATSSSGYIVSRISCKDVEGNIHGLF